MSGVKEAPAPWHLKGTSWIFVLSGLKKNVSFPTGFADAEILGQGGEFVGGLGIIQLVSYAESPVGPYDELIYVPGRWKYPNNDLAFRVTRIYVSTKESTENGRRNWNIPKQVANFDYKPGPNGTTLFGVTLPGSSTPFFKASIKPIPLLSSVSVSFSTTMLGRWYSLMQPPLPSGEKPEEVATDKWAAVTPVLKGKTKVMRFVPGFEDGSVGDGVAFPRVRPWKVASVIQDGELDFAVPTWYDKV